eukprot:2960081-Rhodomonas_salina.1
MVNEDNSLAATTTLAQTTSRAVTKSDRARASPRRCWCPRSQNTLPPQDRARPGYLPHRDRWSGQVPGASHTLQACQLSTKIEDGSSAATVGGC